MKTIHKFPLQIVDEQTIDLPINYNALCVQVQNGIPCLWAEVNTNTITFPKTFKMVGTGHPIFFDESFSYLGTVQIDGLVWHIYY